VLYGIGLSGGIASLTVAGYTASHSRSWTTVAAVVFAAILLTQLVMQIRRNSRRGRSHRNELQ